MTKNIFDFEANFKLGIDEVDSEHIMLVDMLNRVYELLNENKPHEARAYFNETLSTYVHEHFSNEEAFMESFEFPGLEKHKTIHANFRSSFNALKPKIETNDDVAFRQSLRDTFAWIISHIGITDKEYATYYLKQKSG